MFFHSPSTWKMVKYAPNRILVNTIGLAHTSREILKDGDVPIFSVVLITLDFLELNVIVPVSIFHPLHGD